MRWAIIGALGTDTLEFHLHESLTFLGHTVKIFDLDFLFGRGQFIHYWMRKASDKYDQARARKIAREIIDFKPDIVLGTYRIIHPLTIQIIKENLPSVVAIHMNPDHLCNLEQQQIIATDYDFYFTKDPFIQRFLSEKANLNAYYLPEAFNSRYHLTPGLDKNDAESREDIDILIFGSIYPYRAKFIERIANLDYKLKVFGTPGPFFPEKLNHLFNNQVIIGNLKSEKIWGAKIIVNNFHYAEIEGVNCKYFEINGIGGFQLCDYKESLSDYSPVSPYKYGFKSSDQAVELIHRYMNSPEERREIAEIQRNHFVANHTYDHRISEILRIIS
jgi:spore maturation protein CgeB